MDRARKSRNARVFARALGVGEPWSFSAKRRIGTVVFMLGLVALCVALVLREVVVWLVASGLIAMGLGFALFARSKRDGPPSFGDGDGGADLGGDASL
jgi:hypothetical protein